MSINLALGNALSGLNAAQRQAQVSSNNLANALTEGYGARKLELSSRLVGDEGAGVKIEGVVRQVDKAVWAERREADADLGAKSTLSQGMSQLEDIIGGPQDADGLAARITAVEVALTSAAGDPSSDIRLETVAQRLGQLTDGLNERQSQIQQMREDADRSIANQITTLNNALVRVEQLNTDVQSARAVGADTSTLEDQRQTAIDEISDIMPVRVIERERGRLALMSVRGEVMIDGPAVQYQFTPTTTIMPQMTYAGSMLGGVQRSDGTPLSTESAFGHMVGGSLEAAFNLRDETLVEAQTNLDAIARDLAERFQDPAVDPSRAGGSAGLLTDGGAEFLAANEMGLAGRIALNTAADPDAGGDASLIRTGISGAAVPVGDAAQINRWLEGLNEQRSLSVGGASGTASGLAAVIASDIGVQRVAAEEDETFATARWSAIRETELAGGVDSDAELQTLLRVEQAYAANARVIETVQFMMRELMEL